MTINRPIDGVESMNGDSGTFLQLHGPANDGLEWLNDGLPDLRSSPSKGFRGEFDIQKYLHILRDNIRVPGGEESETGKLQGDGGQCGHEGRRMEYLGITV